MLFQADLTGSPPGEIFRAFWTGDEGQGQLREFAERLVVGVLDRRSSLDAIVADSAANWRIERMAVVDRNVLRLGVYEILYESDTPPAVVLDEAIEIAKKFGSRESGAFINGILDDVRQRHQSGKIQVPP